MAPSRISVVGANKRRANVVDGIGLVVMHCGRAWRLAIRYASYMVVLLACMVLFRFFVRWMGANKRRGNHVDSIGSVVLYA